MKVDLPVNEPEDPKVRQVEIAISNILRGGVVASIILVVLGTIITFAKHPEYLSDKNTLRPLIVPSTDFPHSVKDIASGVIHFRGPALIVFGLVILLATPVIRVAASIVAFVYQKDWIFVIITAIVLGLLIFSFCLGKAE